VSRGVADERVVDDEEVEALGEAGDRSVGEFLSAAATSGTWPRL
jgi:hypothetical protein